MHNPLRPLISLTDCDFEMTALQKRSFLSSRDLGAKTKGFIGAMARIGYARVSTVDQNLDLQRDALHAAGCGRIFEDHGISGSNSSMVLEKA